MPLRDSWELKRVPIHSYKKLPRLRHPAGYVCLIRDMDYGSRYKLEPTNNPAAHLDEVMAALPFKTKIAYIVKTNDAKATEGYLRQRYARRSARDEWFDLDGAQLWEIHSLTASGQHDAADWQKERDSGLEEPLPAAHRLERQPPVSLKDLISNSYQTPPSSMESAPPRRRQARQSQAAEEEAAGCNKGCLYFFTGIIALAVLAAAFGARLTDSRLSDSSANQTNTSRSGPRPTATRRPTLTQTPRPTAADTDFPTATDTPTRRPTLTSTSTKRPTSTSTPTQRPKLTSQPTAISTQQPTLTPTHTPTSTAQPTATRITGAAMYVTTRDNMSARVRSCPGTTCGIIGGLKPGAKVQALERVDGETVYGNNEWIQFRHNGEPAYVHSSLVSTKRPNS